MFLPTSRIFECTMFNRCHFPIDIISDFMWFFVFVFSIHIMHVWIRWYWNQLQRSIPWDSGMLSWKEIAELAIICDITYIKYSNDIDVFFGYLFHWSLPFFLYSPYFFFKFSQLVEQYHTITFGNIKLKSHHRVRSVEIQ